MDYYYSGFDPTFRSALGGFRLRANWRNSRRGAVRHRRS